MFSLFSMPKIERLCIEKFKILVSSKLQISHAKILRFKNQNESRAIRIVC